ncbi:MAG: hypothetical protein ACLUKO_04670 [Enterocloster bolteae]
MPKEKTQGNVIQPEHNATHGAENEKKDLQSIWQRDIVCPPAQTAMV